MSGNESPAQICMEPALLNSKDAAAALGGISVRTLDELRKRGRINAKMNGRMAMYTPEELRRYAEDCPDWEPQ